MDSSPVILKNGIEVSIHKCPRILLRELSHVFPGIVSSNEEEPVHAICTCQKAQYDLSEYGERVASEKDNLLENFMEWAENLTRILESKGFFTDYIDPCSGLPMRTRNATCVYSEVDGMELLLRYRSLNAGMCKILVHPSWGTSFYPASMFSKAPAHIIQQAIIDLENHENNSIL